MESPRVQVAVLGCRPDADDPRRWLATWVVRNQGPTPLELDSAWIPHGRFRGAGRLPLSGQIGPGATTERSFLVTAHEAPGTIVENAFVILRVNVQHRAWRIFVRMRIEFDSSAVPVPVVEAITTQSLE